MDKVFYNEIDDFACGWLSNLIDAGKIPPGKIDNRPIQEITLDDLTGYTQCHFFAGIGGWAYALRLAGWPTNRHVWTGSCPCQPFSSAGKQKGKEDERHLWPVWFNLIRQSRPPIVFGEQVSAAILHHWWDDVADDLEGEGYTTRAEIRPACSVGAPHKRDRLWFVAHAQSERSGRAGWAGGETVRGSTARDSLQLGRTSNERGNVAQSSSMEQPTGAEVPRFLPSLCQDGPECDNTSGRSQTCNVADTTGVYAQGREDGQRKEQHWGSGVWIDCPDGKQRLIEPGIRLLDNGIPNRVGRLRGYGNAIVPQLAAEFIKASMESE